MITPLQLKQLAFIKDVVRLTDLTNAINDTLIKFEINTPLRICHFLSQNLYESGNFSTFKENLNYSAPGLVATFHKYFLTEADAIPYARKPDLIANKVYGLRMGNGDEASGDGSRYKGRGFIMCTGRNNYAALSKFLSVDFIARPELLETSKYAALSSGWFWQVNNLNLIADKGNTDEVIEIITKKINGGLLGISDRIANFRKCESIIK